MRMGAVYLSYLTYNKRYKQINDFKYLSSLIEVGKTKVGSFTYR